MAGKVLGAEPEEGEVGGRVQEDRDGWELC